MMAATWKQIADSDDYKNLGADDALAVREDYFSRVVAPSVSTEDLASVRDDFLARTEPTAMDRVKGVARRIVKAVPGIDDQDATQQTRTSFKPLGESNRKGSADLSQPTAEEVARASSFGTPQASAAVKQFNQPQQTPVEQGFTQVATPQKETGPRASDVIQGLESPVTAQDNGIPQDMRVKQINADEQGIPILGADMTPEATQAGLAEARKHVPVTVQPGMEKAWLKKNNPEALARVYEVEKGALQAEIAGGSARFNERIAEQDARNQAAVDAEKANPRLANLKSGMYSAAGGLYGTLSAFAASQSPYGEDGATAQKLLELSNQNKAWAEAIASDASKQNFTDAESKIGWMADQFLLNAPSTATSLVSIFNPRLAPYALGTMAAYSGGGHYTDLVNAGVDNKTATLAAVGHGAVEAAIERAIPIELGQEILKRYRAMPKLAQAEIGRRVVRGIAAGGAAGTAMAVTEGGEEAITGILQRTIDQAVKQDALDNGRTDVAERVGRDGVFDADSVINDTMGGIAGGAPVAGAVGGYGGYVVSRPDDAQPINQPADPAAQMATGGQITSGAAIDQDQLLTDIAAAQPETRVQKIKREIEARKAALRDKIGVQEGGQDNAPIGMADESRQATGDQPQGSGADSGSLAAKPGIGDGADAAGIAPGVAQDTSLGNALPGDEALNAVELIDEAAHQAATSPLNGKPEPTEAQKKAGNYAKGKIKLHGLDISIENPKGSTRSGVDQDGKRWETRLANHYGYIKRTEGADGDQVDVFVGDKPESDKVFVIDQINPKTGKFDEHKVMMGFDGQDEALEAYRANYQKGWKGANAVHAMTADQFKDWLENGDTKRPIGQDGINPDMDEDAPQWAGSYDVVELAKEAPLAGWTLLGKNTEGNDVYEAGTMRAVVDGKYVVRELAHKPKGSRYAEFRTAVELGQKPSRIEQIKAEATAKKGLSIGTTPNNAEPITVKNGVVYVGKFAPPHFETGEDITVPDGANNLAIAKALRDAGALSNKQKIFGLTSTQQAQDSEPASPEAAPVQDSPAFTKPEQPVDAQPITSQKQEDTQAIPSAKPKSAFPSNNLIQRIKQLGGINTQYVKDVTGEGRNRVIGLFRKPEKDGRGSTKAGHGLDTLARILASEGFDIDVNEVDGGVGKLAELVQEALTGRSVLNQGAQEEQLRADEEARYRDDLKTEVKELGGEFAKNISTEKLQALRDKLLAEADNRTKLAAVQLENIIGTALTDAEWAMLMDEANAQQFAYDLDIDLIRQQEQEREAARAIETRYEAEAEGTTEQAAGEGQGESRATGRGEPGTAQAQGPEVLTGYTNQDILAREKQSEQAAAKAEREANKPTGPDVTADQVDLFNTQGGLFGSNREPLSQPKTETRTEPSKQAESESTQERPARTDKIGSQSKGSTLEQYLKEEPADRNALNVVIEVRQDDGTTLRGPRSTHIENAIQSGHHVVLTQRGPALVNDKMQGWNKDDLGAAGMRYANWLDSAAPPTQPNNVSAKAEKGDTTTAESAIRATFNALPSINIGSWYPITVTHNGRTQNFLANQKRIVANGKSDAAIHLVQIRNGRMVAGNPIEPIAYFYKLDGKNNLAEEGIPQSANEMQLKKWRDAGFAVDQAATQPAPQQARGEDKVDNKPAEADKSQKIEDFGEKIGGARKDVWQSYKDKLDDAKDVDVKAEPLSKSWPAPDYEAMLESGADPWAVAFMHAARDEVPSKPSSTWKLSRWVEQVKLLRGFAVGLTDGTYSVERTQEELSKNNAFKSMMSRVDLYQLVGHSQSLRGVSVSSGSYSIYNGVEHKPPKIIWTVEQKAKATAFSNWPRVMAEGNTKEEALANFKAKYDSLEINKPASKEVKFSVYSKYKVDGYFIGKKLGRNYVDLAGPFATVKETREYLRNNQEALVEKLEKVKEIPSVRRDTNEPRVGEDMRGGQDVTPQMFGETFGFKGIEFGNWVEQKKRQKDLNDAFDALMDMAAILDVPPKALSLNGELGLAFGARGTGGIDPAKAHYEPGYVVINLTKKDGAGSLGHEWFHALDNYFSRMRGEKDKYTTNALDVSLAARDSEFVANTAIRKEMIEAFGGVVRAINLTRLKARSAKLDAKRSKDYWMTGEEMAARAFESYLISKLQDQNASNDYLANIVSEETWAAAEKMGFELEESYPYPTAGEVPAIRAAFDAFFQAIETKETDTGTALFSRRADTRANYERRIDDLFSGKPANRVGAMVLDRSDVLDMLGMGDKPVRVAEHKVIASGTNHGLTAEHWKKIPGWLDNPAAVFDSDTQPGRLVFIAPEKVNGSPVRIIVEPNAHVDGLSIHVLVNAYDAQGRDPIRRWIDDGLLRYIDKAKSRQLLESSGLQLPGVLRRSQGANGSIRKIYTDSDLVKSRQMESRASGAPADAHTVDSLRAAMDSAFGKRFMGDLFDTGKFEIVTRSGDALAYYDPQTGKTYFVANHIGRGRDLRGLMLHEIGVHAINLGRNQQAFKSILKYAELMRKTGNKDMQTAYARAQEAKTRPEDMAEEMLGYYVEANPETGFARRVIAWFKGMLLDMGLPPGWLKLTDKDIAAMAANALRGAKTGRARAIGNDGELAMNSGKANWYYSALARMVLNGKQEAMPAQQWKLWVMSNAANNGVKKDEIQWTGLYEWLDLQGKGKVSKADVLNYLNQNGVQVEDVVLSDDETTNVRTEQEETRFQLLLDMPSADMSAAEYAEFKRLKAKGYKRAAPTQFASYQLPGGENYRELLLTLPPSTELPEGFSLAENPRGGWVVNGPGPLDVNQYGHGATPEQALQAFAAYGHGRDKVFRSSHFDQPNILAHVRFNERTDADGKRVLFIEEIQSDFGQSFKKQRDAINRAVDADFEGIVERMKKAGVLEVNCD